MSADGGDKRIDASSAAPRTAPAAPPPEVAKPAAPARGRRRYLVMGAVPLLILLVGGYFWLTGGRYVSTDDAYVQQDRVNIVPLVSGRIVETPVHENQSVSAGDTLFVVDPAPYRIALAAAEAGLASARLQVDQMRAAESAAQAAVKAATDDVAYYQKAFDRQQGLLAKGVASQATYDQAEQNLHNAEQALEQAREKEVSTLAALGGNADIKTDDHPAVLAALARRDQAALDLANTRVTASEAGTVAQADRLVVGQPVSPSTAVMSLVVSGNSWVEANFKETDLGNMRAGQKAAVEIDAYSGKKLEGTIESIGAGTGAEFALLPAQNATGNWVKVVQRIPVRVRFEAPAGLAMRTGLSASVTIDTESGPGTAAAAQ